MFPPAWERTILHKVVELLSKSRYLCQQWEEWLHGGDPRAGNCSLGLQNLRLGPRHPPAGRAGGAVLRLLVQAALKAVTMQLSLLPMPLQKRASKG